NSAGGPPACGATAGDGTGLLYRTRLAAGWTHNTEDLRAVGPDRSMSGRRCLRIRMKHICSESQSMNRVGGIVLCGGKSSRMGRARSGLPLGDEFMLQRVVRMLSRAVSPIVVVAAPDQEVPPLPEAVILARDPEEFRGPLQGLAVGLTVLRAEVH